MEKKYQVFISSTYDDLKLERRKAMEALLDSNCIPAGMELFPAADEEQFEFIKKVINNCDYYVLIIGSRYGSVSSDGISYTEKEFDYATSRGIKVIALIQKEAPKSSEAKELQDKLHNFINKVTTGRVVAFWEDANDLALKTFKAIAHAKENYEAIGWVRADKVNSEQILLELNDSRKENEVLRAKFLELEYNQDNKIENLADMDSQFTINISYYSGDFKNTRKIQITWNHLFSLISTYLLSHPNDNKVERKLTNELVQRFDIRGRSHDINSHDYETIKIQLKAYGLVQIRYIQTTQGGMALFWSLTPQGEKLMMNLRTVKSVSDDIFQDKTISVK
jgi:hypothetical protein